ncbi:MAG: SRPBCC family protein [Gramella sp.]|nr:SRPBCC family protein [Christiangramia sp.]
MKIKGYIDINKSRDAVVKYFADPRYLAEFQDGFIEKVLISGEEGKQGAISEMYYKQGKKKMVLTETIIDNQLPEYFESNYSHKHMDNTMKCEFTELGQNITRYNYEFEYTRINWIMPKLISILFPGMYRKPAEKWMLQFKEFVEKQ